MDHAAQANSSTAFQIAALRLAKSKGVRPEQLTPSDLLSINIGIRSTRELLSDGINAAKSLISTSLGRTVPLEVYEARKTSCRTCPYVLVLADNDSINCSICGCGGRLMDAALQDPSQSCRLPVGKKRWEEYLP